MDTIILDGKNAIADVPSVYSGDKVAIVTLQNGEKAAIPLAQVSSGDKVNILQLQNGEKLAVKCRPSMCRVGIQPEKVVFGTTTTLGTTPGWLGITYYYKLTEIIQLITSPQNTTFKVTTTPPVYNPDAYLGIQPWGWFNLSISNDEGAYESKTWQNVGGTISGGAKRVPCGEGITSYTEWNGLEGSAKYVKLVCSSGPYELGKTALQILNLQICQS